MLTGGNDRSKPAEKQLPVCSTYDVCRHIASGSSEFNGILMYWRNSRVQILQMSSFQRKGGVDLQALSFGLVEIRDQHWTGPGSRTLDTNTTARERLFPPQPPPGWGLCGKEFPCKWTSSFPPTGSGSESQKSTQRHQNDLIQHGNLIKITLRYLHVHASDSWERLGL